MKDTILKGGAMVVLGALIGLAVSLRSANKRIAKQEDALLAFVNATIGTNGLWNKHLQYQHGMKLATVEAGLTPEHSSNLYNAAKKVRSEPESLRLKSWDEAKIERIKRQHEHFVSGSRNGIMLGYTACRLGINLSNYLAEVEVGWSNMLVKQITEAKEHKP